MSLFKNNLIINEELSDIKYTKIQLINNSFGSDLESYKIIFLADFHYGVYTNPNLIEKVISITNENKPNLILLGGDYVHMGKSHLRKTIYQYSGNIFSNYIKYRRSIRFSLIKLNNLIKELHAPEGIVGVFGNHDYMEGIRTVKKYITGVSWLVNSKIQIPVKNSKINVYGIDDCREGMPDLEKTFSDFSSYHSFLNEEKNNQLNIFLGHNPDTLILKDAEYIRGVDISLFGHTHGGQICLPGSIPLKTETRQKDFFKGFSRFRESPVYVSSGIGNSGINFRLFCPPEIVEITLKNTT